MPVSMEDALNELTALFCSGQTFQAVLLTDLTTNQLISSVNASTNTFTSAAHNLANSCRVEIALTTPGALPAPLVAATTYYVVNKTTDTFQLSLAKGGAVIDLTDIGSGALSVVEKTPDYSLDDWVVWERLEANYQGTTRQGFNFTGVTPTANVENLRAELPPILLTFKPTIASLTYRYLGILVNGSRLRWITDYGTTQTIQKDFPLGFSYQPYTPLVV